MIWSREDESSLIATVADHIATFGAVNWTKVSTELGVSAIAASTKYPRLVQQGRCESITGLIQRRKVDGGGPPKEQDVKTITTSAGIESTAVGSKIKTVEDLLAHIKADMTKYEIDKFEASKWDGQMKGPNDKPIITELHRVWVRLKPKVGPNIQEQVETIIAGAFATRKRLKSPVAATRASRGSILGVIVIPEPHFGKFAWNAETGHGDYDLKIAAAELRTATAEIFAAAKRRDIAKWIIACIGDYFHADTPAGTTTRGTPLDQDGRIQKALKEGSEVLFDTINEAAELADTEVILTPGNHDEILTHALQRILVSEFRHDKRVTIDDTFTPRKYRLWGKTQLGFTHGATPPIAKLPGIMAREVPKAWGDAIFREIHTGDKHARAAIQTIDGVLVRTCPSLSAADKWHNDNGFVGAARMMESFYYSSKGALVGMDASTPVVTNGVL